MPAHSYYASCLILGLATIADPALARRCEVDGADVNPDNGATLAGKTGILRCYGDDGRLRSEQELRDGEYLGLDKHYRDDGSVSERQINANRNSHGAAREYYANGQLNKEGEYDDGRAIGKATHYYPDGKLKALWFHSVRGQSETASIEYTADGRVQRLQCAKRSVLSEDREICGHDGQRRTVTLFSARGAPQQRVDYFRGVLIKSERLGAQGQVESSYEIDDGRVIERSFYSDGQISAERVFKENHVVSDRAWYMNGRSKRVLLRSDAPQGAQISIEEFRDDGTLQMRERKVDGARVYVKEAFDARGALVKEEHYGAEGKLTLRRKFAPDGQVVSTEEFYEDGSRKLQSDALINDPGR